MGNKLTNDLGGGSVPGLRVAPALATLLLLLMCLQVCCLLFRPSNTPTTTLNQVLINPAPFPASKPNDGDKLLQSSSTTTTTTRTTTTRMVLKDTRRLYARRQQVVVNAAPDQGPHEVADDPFEPRLNLQLRNWYQWLMAHGGDAATSDMVPDAMPSLPTSTNTTQKHL